MSFLHIHYMLAFVIIIATGCVPISLTTPVDPMPSVPITPLESSPPDKPVYLTVNVPKTVCPTVVNKINVVPSMCPPLPEGCHMDTPDATLLKEYTNFILPPGIPTDLTLEQVVQHHAATLAAVLGKLRKTESLIAEVVSNVECN